MWQRGQRTRPSFDSSLPPVWSTIPARRSPTENFDLFSDV
jgi:hypothetical protein